MLPVVADRTSKSAATEQVEKRKKEKREKTTDTLHQWAGPLCILPLVAFAGAHGKSSRAAVQPTSRSENVTKLATAVHCPAPVIWTYVRGLPFSVDFHFAYATRQL
jgi:hypothetical protein